jgi:hypothetical protein
MRSKKAEETNKISLPTDEQKERIKEILDEEGYTVLGFGQLDGRIIVGAKSNEQLKIEKKVKDELGIDVMINL